jgi:hypothetical protein
LEGEIKMTERNDVQLRDEDTKSAESYINGSDIATNGGFETWEGDPLLPTNFTCESEGATLTQEGTIKYAGNYSVKFTNDLMGTGYVEVEQLYSSLTPGAYYRAKIYARDDVDNRIGFYFLNEEWDSATQIYNFTLSQWETLDPESDPGEDHMTWASLNGSFALKTTPLIPVPASGKILVCCTNDWTGNYPSGTAYIDNFQMYPVTVVPETYISAGDLRSTTSNGTLCGASDYGLKTGTTGVGGVGTIDLYSISFDGKHHTDKDDFDFSETPVAVATPTDSDHAVTKSYADGLIIANIVKKVAITGNVDLKSTGTTDIYTVPTGYRFITTDVYYEGIDMSGITNLGTSNIGSNATSYNNIISTYSYLIGFTNGEMRSLGPSDAAIISAGSVIKINVTVGATATTCTVKVHLLGYLETV